MTSELDDPEICLCFHVHHRKLSNWIRVERPQRAAQLSECYGAGTGCGWCRRVLEMMFLAAQDSASPTPELPDPQAYRRQRQEYLRQKGRTLGTGEGLGGGPP
jgi:bacterioferritin-associated ferredoxin